MTTSPFNINITRAASVSPVWQWQGTESLNISRTRINRPLVILALVHLLSGPCLAFFAFFEGPEIIDAVYQGLFFSQLGLLGIWSGLATYGRGTRLMGFTIGLVILADQYCFRVNNWEFLTLLFVILPTVTVAGIMLVVRRFVAKLERTAASTVSPRAEGLQFSIRQLMVFTLVVGCLLGIVRWLQPHVRSLQNPTLFPTVFLGSVSIAIAAVWATLRSAHPLRRLSAVLLYGLLMGCVAYLTTRNSELWYWLAMMAVQAAVLLASLLVVRQCGFRLVRACA